MFKDATTMIRDYIAKNGDEWQMMITDRAFAEVFDVKGEALKNVPRGYDSTHSQAKYLKNTSWYLEYPISDELILDYDKFIERATEKFVIMQPFNSYLNEALVGFEMPERS